MDTKTFLTRVSAPLDNLVVCLWKPDSSGKSPNGIFWNRGSYADYDAAVADIATWDQDADWTVYFSVGRMADNAYTKDNGNTGYYRTQKHATWFKAICFDMDIGDKYATQKEGHAALTSAAQSIGLPEPMVVSSGRGIHYYWPLTAAVDKARWVEVSTALRLALAEHEVQIDNSKIHDPSMVLRPVGTHHKKQTPWRDVKLMRDCPDYDISALTTPLQKWIGSTVTKAVKKLKPNSIVSSVLKNCNLNIVAIGKKCNQIGALLASGGEFNAEGERVKEPLWRAALGMAAYAVDQEAAMMMLCSKHPDFDHDANMAKMAKWTTKPTTCEEFEKHCPGGCVGCKYKGIVSPVSLNEDVPTLPPSVKAQLDVEEAKADPVFSLPEGYYVSNGKIYRDVETEAKEKDADGKTTTVTKLVKTLICPYELHIIDIFNDYDRSNTVAILATRYPDGHWEEHDVDTAAIFAGGTDYRTLLSDKMLFIESEATLTHTRTFLMRYLQKVQAERPLGANFAKFGWQKDGSFLCGGKVIGSPTGSTMYRLQGTAKHYGTIVAPVGSREVWADMTKYVDEPHAETLGVSLLIAAAGALGNAAGGVSSMLISFHSPETGTGKSLALGFGNSVFMDPSLKHMINPTDTDNSIYHILGVLGDLSGSIDELTLMQDDMRAAQLALQVSQGREKHRLDSNSALRRTNEWNAPVRVSSNKSLYDMYDLCFSRNEPHRLRTLQFEVSARDFVAAHGAQVARTMTDNYGHAMPELVQAVVDLGGRRAVWDRGVVEFDKKYKFEFRSEERFFRSACIHAYTIGVIGRHLGLFRFNLDRVIQFMLNRVVYLRHAQSVNAQDCFDTLGQFMQEHNHMLIVSKREASSKDAKVQFPVPDNACMRMDVVWDANSAVLHGSTLHVNAAYLRKWLSRTKDSLDRFTSDLQKHGAVIGVNQRVTLYKGCSTNNPGQAHCLQIDLTHHRLAQAIASKPVLVASPVQAVLQPVPATASPVTP